MRQDFKFKKRAIIIALAMLIAADIALGAYTWDLASARSAQQNLDFLSLNRDLLKKDIVRAENISRRIPAIRKDCDAFESSLFPESTGYSSVTAELSSLAAKSGLQLDNRAFRRKEVKGRGLTEVQIEATVAGGYAGVVRFLNGLQRSQNVYAVESLSAKSDAAQVQGPKGQLRVTIHLKTYFRAA
jgi:Tfp pilus assembly protein PilO